MTPPSTLAVITARGGSKGITRKNLQPLCGRPLLTYTIDAARGSKLLNRCIVSTDDEEIAACARAAGADAPFLRPRELATDDALALAVLAHAIWWLREEEGTEYDYAMMLQPTSPLRTAADIDACITIAEQTGADSVFSMVELPDFAPEKLKTIRNGQIFPLLAEEKGQSTPRHRGPAVYKRNCAIYLTRTRLILQGDQFGQTSMAYVMPRERSVDINDPTDLALAEFWMEKHGTQTLKRTPLALQ